MTPFQEPCRRSARLRSTGVVPPQIPLSSLSRNAVARQSTCTGQWWQISLANLLSDAVSGLSRDPKNASNGYPRQSASSCQCGFGE